jgi:hypothetical protein
MWNLHVFGRRLTGSNGVKRSARSKRATERRARATAVRAAKRVDIVDAVGTALDVLLAIGIESVDLDVCCAFDDPLANGRAAEAIALLFAALAPVGDVRGGVDWLRGVSGEPAIDLGLALTLRFSPAHVAWIALAFAARYARARLRAMGQARRAGAVTAPSRA